MRNKLLKKFSYVSHFNSLDFGFGMQRTTILDYADIYPSFFNRKLEYYENSQGPRNTFNYSQSSYLDKEFMISDTKYNSTSYTKIYNTIYFIINKFPLYKTKKYLDLNFNTLIQTWIKNFNLEKKLINNNKK